MKRNILLIAVLLLSSLLIACGKPEKIQTADSLDPSTAVSDTDGKLPDTFAEAREREDFVVLGNDNQLLRGELWEAFLDAAARNEEARVTIVRATEEGDPIYYHLTYRDNRYLLFPDYTHDRFGAELAKQAEEKEYTTLERLETDRSVDYILTNEPFGSDEAYAEYWERIQSQTVTPDRTFEILINLAKEY
ncbi:MAG: DUF4362 domain-containing protein [Clostridia bacterium]|nr:DUF4362 domain-containing protein [Clostridia bacterium]